MKNLSQIQVIQTALTKEKEKHLHELAIVVKNIDKKMTMINRMVVYQNEYVNSDNLKISKSIPSLIKNLYAFSGKMDDLIKKAEIEIVEMQKTKEAILTTIEQVDNKIKVMNIFEESAKKEAFLKAEKREQAMADDLVSIKHVGGESYE